MDKYLSVSKGGIPKVLDDIRWYLGQANNQGVYQALNNILGAYGTDIILQGCVVDLTVPAVATMTEGWIYLGGELLKVDANAGFDSTTLFFFTKVVTTDTTGDKTLQSGATANTYQKNRAVLNSATGVLRFDGARISKIKTFTEAKVTGTIGTSETEILNLTPSATLGAAKMSMRGFIRVTPPTVASAAVNFIYIIKINDIEIRGLAQTVKQDGAFHVLPFEWILPYVAGEIVTIKASFSGAAGTFEEGILICESWDGIS